MTRLLVALALVAGFAPPVMAMSDAECDALWRKADVNSDGLLTEGESERYLAAMRTRNREVPASNNLSMEAFRASCLADDFKSADRDPGAPLKGANSFTEGQAKDRALAAGFTEISPLKKDEDGIWRGSAKDGSNSVSIAIDYKGNVVGQVQ